MKTIDNYISLDEIINLVIQHEPSHDELISALRNCHGGKWKRKAYFQFVDSKNANQIGAEWQFEDSFIFEHPNKGTIVIDFLKSKSVGGIEFLELI